VSHLLVTNDFPPKIGGIQAYLYELWRRLPPDDFTVLTTKYEGASDFDEQQSFRIVRSPLPVLLPTPMLARQVRALAEETGSQLVLLDPAVPLGLLGPLLGIDYGVVLHGAETTIPGRLPLARHALAKVIGDAKLIVAAGTYARGQAERLVDDLPPVVMVPPGVDIARFHPLNSSERRHARQQLGLPLDSPLVVSVSRLVPRKGMDVLIEAVGLLKTSMPDISLAIAGGGRDLARLKSVARRASVEPTWLGRVSEEDKALLNGTADVWAMLCRDRMLGLLQEGFGIVFMEAAAAGVPQVAGKSGGAVDAVVDGVTGYVVGNPADPAPVAAALRRLLENPALARRLGAAARERAVAEFDYDVLAPRLLEALREAGA
jgi:phosphatidylinositol alpha-1,6-mannosyltransferase